MLSGDIFSLVKSQQAGQLGLREIISNSAAEEYVHRLIVSTSDINLIKIYEFVRDKDDLVVTYDKNLISRTLTHLFGFRFGSEQEFVIGYHSMETRKIYLLIDNSYVASKTFSQDVAELIKSTFIHECCHYFATFKPKEYCKIFDSTMQTFYKLVFTGIDPKLQYYRISDTYYDLIVSLRHHFNDHLDRYLTTQFETFIDLNADQTLRQFVEQKDFKSALTYMLRHPYYVKYAATLLTAFGKTSLAPYSFFSDMYNAYVKLTGSFQINLFYQEFLAPDEIISVLSQTKKSKEIVSKLARLT